MLRMIQIGLTLSHIKNPVHTGFEKYDGSQPSRPSELQLPEGSTMVDKDK
jgi:hypothetical protein